MIRKHWQMIAAIALSLSSGVATAQQWPSKAIVFVSPGAADVAPRVVAEELSKALGQPIVVDTHAGASGIVSAEYTLRQPADGHTFLAATSALMAAPYSFKISFDVLRDFVPVSVLATAPFVLVAHPSLPVASLADLIALARKRPGELNISSTAPGSSSTLTAELFKTKAGIDIAHVAHKTMGTALIDVVAGHVQLCMSAGPNAVAQIKAGKLRALAASTPSRSSVLPEVPTFSELGYPDVALTAWYGLLARSGTPPAILSRMNAEIVNAIRKPDVRERLLKAAVEPVGNSPQEFAAFMKTDSVRWGEAARAARSSEKTPGQKAP
jgi:tripartite-type tricarboxylate transporter receptor subunit TctC